MIVPALILGIPCVVGFFFGIIFTAINHEDLAATFTLTFVCTAVGAVVGSVILIILVVFYKAPIIIVSIGLILICGLVLNFIIRKCN